MNKDVILIDKELVPYIFNIALGDVMYTVEVRHNSEADLFTIALYDINGNLICTEPVIYGAVLFEQQYQPEIYPAVTITPLDESGEETAVTWENFNKTVFLFIDNVQTEEADGADG